MFISNKIPPRVLEAHWDGGDDANITKLMDKGVTNVALPTELIKALERYARTTHPMGTLLQHRVTETVRTALSLLLAKEGVYKAPKQPESSTPELVKKTAKALRAHVRRMKKRFPELSKVDIRERLLVAYRCRKVLASGFTLKDLAEFNSLKVKDLSPVLDEEELLDVWALNCLTAWLDFHHFP